MAEVATNSVNIERFLAVEGQILQPVPEENRAEFKYWRGAHLGKIALNYAQGQPSLNSRQNSVVAHFTPDYKQACIIAKGLTLPHLERKSQFNKHDAEQFEELFGIDESFSYPAIVYALDSSMAAANLIFHKGARGAASLEKPLSLDMIDPYSQGAIKELLGLD